MKIPLTATLSIVLSILLIAACKTESEAGKSDNIKGIYSFSTKEGFYGEIWIDEENLAISKRNRPIAIFPYRTVGDTIKMYLDKRTKAKDSLIDFLVITARTDSSISILQDTVRNRLELVSRELPPLNKDGETIRTIKKQFRERLRSSR